MTIKLKGSSDGSVSLTAPADTSPSGTDITLTLPTDAGSANQFIKNSGTAGTLDYSSMVENSSGNVGFGTAAGSQRIKFSDSSDTVQGFINAQSDVTHGERVTIGTLNDAYLNFYTNDTERLRIDSSGRLLVGSSSNFVRGNVQVIDGGGGELTLGRNDTSVSSGNDLGHLFFASNAGGTGNACAAIHCFADGDHGSNDYPTRLSFVTTPDGGSSTVERMQIDSSGRILIGSSTVQAHANMDDLQVGNGTGNRGITISSVNTGFGTLAFGDSTDGSGTDRYAGFIEYYHNDNSLRLGTGAQERFRIDSSGNVGIGTSSPSQILELKTGEPRLCLNATNAASSLGIEFEASGQRQGHIFHNHTTGEFAISCGENTSGSHFMTFKTGNGSTRMRIDSSGNVGIGCTSAAQVLQVHKAGSNASYIHVTNGTSGATSSDGSLVGLNENAEIIVWNQENTNTRFATNNTERMRIDTNGMVRTRGTDASGALNVFSSIGGSTSANLILGQHSASDITSGTLSFLVYTNGNVVNSNNSYGSLSDVNLKENIVDANSQWADIKGVRVRNYNFKEETGNETFKQLGVVAQEVEEVSPGLVTTNKDGIKSVNYSVLYMKAVKALQEAMTRIETLETKVAALEAE